MFRTNIHLDNTEQVLDFYTNYESNKSNFIIKDDKVYKKRWYDVFFLAFDYISNEKSNSERLGNVVQERVVKHVNLDNTTEGNVKKVNDFYLTHKDLKKLVITDTIISEYNRAIGSNFDTNTPIGDLYQAKQHQAELSHVYTVISTLPENDPLRTNYLNIFNNPLETKKINQIVADFKVRAKTDLKMILQSRDPNVHKAVELAGNDAELLAIYSEYLKTKPLNANALKNKIKDYYFRKIDFNTQGEKGKYFGYFDSDRQHFDEVFTPTLINLLGDVHRNPSLAFTAHLKLQQQKREGSEEVKKIALALTPAAKTFISENPALLKYLNILDSIVADAVKIRNLRNKDHAVDFDAKSAAEFITSINASSASKIKSLAGIKTGLSDETKEALRLADNSENKENLNTLLKLIESLGDCEKRELSEIKKGGAQINNSAPFRSFLSSLNDEEAVQFITTLKSNMSSPYPRIRELTNRPVDSRVQTELDALYKNTVQRRKILIDSYNALAVVELEGGNKKEKEIAQFIELVKEMREIRPFSESKAKALLGNIECREKLKNGNDFEEFLFNYFKLNALEPVAIESFDYNDQTIGNIIEKYFPEAATAFLNAQGVKTFKQLRVKNLESLSKAEREESFKRKLIEIEASVNNFTKGLEAKVKEINSTGAPRDLTEYLGDVLEIRGTIADLIRDKEYENVTRERELNEIMKGFKEQIKDFK